MKGHKRKGEVTAINAHGNKGHVRVEVTHGRRSPKKKGDTSPFPYDDRPTSSMVLSKDQAANYHIGQKVHVGMMPQEENDTDAADGDGDEGDFESQKQSAAGGLFRARRGKD
jgi:hypothetical protein